MRKERLDILLFNLGQTESRSQAQGLIMAGQVRVDGQVVIKPATLVDTFADITIDAGPQFVSRGGEKLQAALRVFSLQVTDRICADVGASTGGFTDCLLQHQAKRVYSIDVGYGLLHWKLRNDPRVELLERTNARFIEKLPEPISLVTIDASFISLKILLPVIKNWFGAEGGEVIPLIKPQFEAGRVQSARGKGVIRDPQVHRQIIQDVIIFCLASNFSLHGLVRSPLIGPKGNIEFLAHLVFPAKDSADFGSLIDQVF